MPQKREDVSMAPGADFTYALEETKQIIKQLFTKYKLEEVFLSFNGGKDCTVLLDITINVLKEIHNREEVARELKVMYIRTNSPFREIEDFINEVESHYGLQLSTTEGDMKSTLQRILDDDPRLQACFMGTRRTDPHSEDLHFVQKTDPTWPQVLRVSPLLNWTYHQIWNYILTRGVPYCSLYEKGYTSIGSTINTKPNPALLAKDKSGEVIYLPAWHLADASLERSGRGQTNSIANGHTQTLSETTNGHTDKLSATTNGHTDLS